MILLNVTRTIQTFFTFKGFSTVYRVIKHFPNNTTLVQSVNDGRTLTIASDKQIELVTLSTL